MEWLLSFNHLSRIVLSHKAGPVDLILGVQYSHLHAKCEIRQGRPFDPVGKRTKLGWFVIGSDNAKNSDTVCSISFVEPLNISESYELETLGVQARDCPCSRVAMLPNKAIELMENSRKHRGERYMVGLPWQRDKSLLPNNYPLAEKRLFSLERNRLKNEAKAKLYDNAIMEYEKNGLARGLSEEDSEANVKPVHYLPHHGIYRPDIYPPSWGTSQRCTYKLSYWRKTHTSTGASGETWSLQRTHHLRPTKSDLSLC